ncbi:MAG TPA: preprotein translocase subunit YajC [Syntrophomonadaceae bacterium]|nr:preprotein translocase subunit YajC [Syntrophomonadaceae bacterium]
MSLLIYFGVFILLFWLLIIYPRKKQEKKHQEIVEALKRGDKVVTIGGIRGEVAKVKDDTIIIRVADNVELEFLKTAIGYKEDNQ